SFPREIQAMALLEMGGKRFTIPAGEVHLGSDACCTIQLGGPGVLAKHAVFRGTPDGQVGVRKVGPDAAITITGVRLGAEPTPLSWCRARTWRASTRKSSRPPRATSWWIPAPTARS